MVANKIWWWKFTYISLVYIILSSLKNQPKWTALVKKGQGLSVLFDVKAASWSADGESLSENHSY